MNSSRKSKAGLSVGDPLACLWHKIRSRAGLSRGAVWGTMIVGALAAFELFNFGTTEYALRDLLGGLTFVGLPWATVLAVAFCCIDFAGIARIFTPGDSKEGTAEVWYLFAAWLLAACFNAALTWWGVSIAMLSQADPGAPGLLAAGTLTTAAPIFVAVLVWLIRVLIIGTFSAAGDHLFSTVSAESALDKRSIEVLGRPRQEQQADPAF